MKEIQKIMFYILKSIINKVMACLDEVFWQRMDIKRDKDLQEKKVNSVNLPWSIN